jgi:hypothetical protein
MISVYRVSKLTILGCTELTTPGYCPIEPNDNPVVPYEVTFLMVIIVELGLKAITSSAPTKKKFSVRSAMVQYNESFKVP